MMIVMEDVALYQQVDINKSYFSNMFVYLRYQGIIRIQMHLC